MTYGGNASTVEKVKNKLARAEDFARDRFPGDLHHYSVWSLRVPEGAMTTAFADLSSTFAERGERLEFIINKEYGDRVQELVDVARTNSRATSDPAFRLLQVLTRVKTSNGRLHL